MIKNQRRPFVDPQLRPSRSACAHSAPPEIILLNFMKHTLLAASLIGASLGAAAQPPQTYPLKDFFRNPERGYFRLAQDGNMLGFMEPATIAGQPPRMNIFVQPLDGSRTVGEPRRLTAETERDISNFFWKGPDIVLYQKDFGGDENFHVLAVNVKTGAITDLTPYEKVRASIEDDLEDDPDHILISHNQRDPHIFDVYRVNVHTGVTQMVAQNPGNIIGWHTDHDGKVRAATASDGLNTLLLYRASETEQFRTLITTDYRTTVSPLFFTSDNRKLYALSNRGRDKAALVIIDPAAPDQEQLLFEAAHVDLSSAGYSRKRKVLTLAGVAFTPDLYAAAVDYVGVSNLLTFMNTIPPYWKPLLAKMHDMVGDPEKDRERLTATSPALHVDRIKTPLLIAQGAQDPRVNKDESDQVVKALRARGVEVQYLVKDNEGHGFHNDENKFEFYTAMEQFFIQHLKPK